VAKKRKNKSELKRGPFTTRDVERALKLDGWVARGSGGKHPRMYEHPTKSGKNPVSDKWNSIHAGDRVFKSLCQTMGVTKDELLELLNGQKPSG